MVEIYRLDVPIGGKVVRFLMSADEGLKAKRKIKDEEANRWRAKLHLVANSIFEEK